MLGETRTPDLFLFLTWQNDTGGTVGTGRNSPICLDAQSFEIVEARTDDNYSGSVIKTDLYKRSQFTFLLSI